MVPPASMALAGMTALEGFLPSVYRVVAKRRETADTITLTVESKLGSPAAIGRPGQFNMLYAHGIGEIPVSVSGASKDGALMHTVRGVGAVSSALCGLRLGAEIGVRGPYGTHWPLDELKGRSLLIVAGGLGLAPLRTSIQHIVDHRSDFADVKVFIGGRTPRDLAFSRDVTRWRQAKARLEVGVTVDMVPPSFSGWGGAVGIVTALLPRQLPSPTSWSALICGPEVMMRHAAADLVNLGLKAHDIYVSLERNMKCAIGLCGHCQLASYFICRDGPVLSMAKAQRVMAVKEL